MYDGRFFFAPVGAAGRWAGWGRYAASRCGAGGPQGCAVGETFRCGGDCICACVFATQQGPRALGAGPCVTAREWAGVWSCAQGCAAVAGRSEPCARCAVGDGGGGILWRVGRCGGRSAWRAARAGLHSDQAIGDAGRGDGVACLAHPVGCCRGVECGAGAVADWITAVGGASIQCGGPWCARLGGGAVSGAGACARCLGGPS